MNGLLTNTNSTKPKPDTPQPQQNDLSNLQDTVNASPIVSNT